MSSKSKDNKKSKDKKDPEPVKSSVDLEVEEIQLLTERIRNEAPESGSQLRKDEPIRFDSLPLSKKTLEALSLAKLETATEIQAAAIPHAIAGRDILGAAKTGSGKTLAFVVPMLEKLYRERWTTEDGLAAIIITPTRELALQIFEVLRTVGKKHSFSAGLVTGGKKEFEGEQERVVRMNILVATPGRLLQHFEQTSGFDASTLMVLILDEADRILDMGFKTQLDSILDYLPTYRQTMLFSATQTKSVKDLARLSLKKPEYLAVHAEDKESTPKQLIQNYIICPLEKKLDTLFSFIKSHLKSKMIIFFSTCSQVRFVYECFRGMQPGIVLTALHGKIKQEKRTLIFMDFLKRDSACMLATDIAARGLDFPNVDWVIQADAPEDSAMYIHRVGRTARYNANGRGLLLVMPNEEEQIIKTLHENNIPIKKLTVNSKRTFSVTSMASSLLAANPEFRLLAKKAFCGYLRSIQLLPLHPVLNIKALPCDAFATSLGLPFTPDVPVLHQQQTIKKANDNEEEKAPNMDEVRGEIRDKKNVNRTLDKLKKQIKEAKEAKKKAREEAKRAKELGLEPPPMPKDDSDSDEDLVTRKSKDKKPKKAQSITELKKSVESKKSALAAQENDDEDEFLVVKQVHNWGDDNNGEEGEAMDIANDDNLLLEATKSDKKVKPLKIKVTKDGRVKTNIKGTTSNKVVFDEDGEEIDNTISLVKKTEVDESVGERIQEYTTKIKQKVDAKREEDNLREKQRIKDKKLKLKQDIKEAQQEKLLAAGKGYGENTAMLSNPVVETAEYGEYDEGSQSDDESDASSVYDGRGKVSYSSKHANDDDSSDSDSDSDEEQIVKGSLKKKITTNKRSRNDSESDDSSDSESSDSDNDRYKKKKTNKTLSDQEKLVLQMIEGKKH